MGTSVDFETVMGLIFDGRLRPIIDTVYPLEHGLTALQRLQSGNVIGKLVVRIR
jgi:NADPH:quinone reductase-like Zn-dependent oxidoreductase